MSEKLVICLFIAGCIVFRLLLGKWNHWRIREYIAGQGGSVHSIQWNPFGAGWFGEKDSIIYFVNYRDSEGNSHEAHCKVGIFSGVYFSNDIVKLRATPRRSAVKQQNQPAVQDARIPTGIDLDYNSLLNENRKLKEEVKRLNDELDLLRR